MKAEIIQTLHPLPGKINKKISLEKYTFIRDKILAILKKAELTHTELMEELYARVKDDFEGGVQWYGETVKLDLEARKLIERTKTKPEKYKLKASEIR
ncbi:MAG: hypothetical protein IPM96_14760 [Ignavibacteria bacterium]|nr:hypothetical protein [Ignavibacteria bacterium]